MNQPLAPELARLYTADRLAHARSVRRSRLASQEQAVDSPAGRHVRRRLRVLVLDALRA